ncbi:MAG: hypothetical protein ACOZNI_21340 [Myxococcota bacterium]
MTPIDLHAGYRLDPADALAPSDEIAAGALVRQDRLVLAGGVRVRIPVDPVTDLHRTVLTIAYESDPDARVVERVQIDPFGADARVGWSIVQPADEGPVTGALDVLAGAGGAWVRDWILEGERAGDALEVERTMQHDAVAFVGSAEVAGEVRFLQRIGVRTSLVLEASPRSYPDGEGDDTRSRVTRLRYVAGFVFLWRLGS